MIYSLYSVRDIKNGFQPPFASQNDDMAQRDFSMAINSGKGILSACPEDFELYKVATFDTDFGLVELTGKPDFVVSGNDLRKKV